MRYRCKTSITAEVRIGKTDSELLLVHLQRTHSCFPSAENVSVEPGKLMCYCSIAGALGMTGMPWVQTCFRSGYQVGRQRQPWQERGGWLQGLHLEAVSSGDLPVPHLAVTQDARAEASDLMRAVCRLSRQTLGSSRGWPGLELCREIRGTAEDLISTWAWRIRMLWPTDLNGTSTVEALCIGMGSWAVNLIFFFNEEEGGRLY